MLILTIHNITHAFNRFVSVITTFFKKWNKAIAISVFNAIFITIFTYILDNQTLFTGEDLSHYAFVELFKNKALRNDSLSNNNAFFINVAYDKQLVPYYEKNIEEGNIVITDRAKLISLLRKIKRINNYKFIFLDIRFEKGIQDSINDKVLFNEIKDTRNIVVATHQDIEPNNTIIKSKLAMGDYDYSLFSTSFCRYLFKPANGLSMPLYAYTTLTGKNINKHGFIYTSDGQLCYNSIFIDFPLENFNSLRNDGTKKFYNMGSDVLFDPSDTQLSKLTKDKFIVIGDMINDVHDTYAGKMPGSVINYRAFNALMEGKHIVNFPIIILMACIYFAISFIQFVRIALKYEIPFVRNIKSKLFNFSLSFVTYTIILNLFVILLKTFCGVSVSVFIATLFLSIQKVILKYKYQQK